MLILDEGYWHGYSCFSRAAIHFSLGIACYIIVLYLYISLLALSAWRKRSFRPNVLPYETSRLRIGSVLCLVIIVTASSFSAMARDRDVLILRGSELIERGCYRLGAFEEVIDFRSAAIRFTENLHGSRAADGIEISTPNRHTIGIKLADSKHIENLWKAFPEQMQAYIATLRTQKYLSPSELEALGHHLPEQ